MGVSRSVDSLLGEQSDALLGSKSKGRRNAHRVRWANLLVLWWAERPTRQLRESRAQRKKLIPANNSTIMTLKRSSTVSSKRKVWYKSQQIAKGMAVKMLTLGLEHVRAILKQTTALR
mmetsp:Transcript_31603/g.58243  ORF Transcript_31603/g.58243 Transcript_31603/m.58243 type:complete len:118 (-) Transcript_31603:601-954(-)